jgi:branched-chain amino acid transport system permease protein
MHAPITPEGSNGLFSRILIFSSVPFLAWLLGSLAAVLLEQSFGLWLAQGLGLPRIPVLFGLTIMLKTPSLIPGSLVYTGLIFILPLFLAAKLLSPVANVVAGKLVGFSVLLSALVHLGLLFIVCDIWTGLSDYRLITLKLILIAILLTLSLNVINGYMGEFSCSHPGFMALGAYGASVFTVGLFFSDRLLGEALFNTVLAPLFFPLGLIFGGLIAALGALLIAIPSFKTRGDYLAIISLAFLFIVKSFVENLEFVGGPRGMGGQPDWATLPVVFGVVVFGVWMINNFVNSTMGKSLNAVRDDESAAEAMTVDTRRTKIVAFLFGAFWAGVAGGLFAHVLRYVNPSTFGLQKLAEILAMMYFGGLNSVYGSIVGAVSIGLLEEALRPLQIFKWIIIPLLLILVMIFRPRGMISFTELKPSRLFGPKGD